MTLSFNPRPRRDGKYAVTLSYAGAPNMFGGHYPSRNYNKLYTKEQLLSEIEKNGTEVQKAWAARANA